MALESGTVCVMSSFRALPMDDCCERLGKASRAESPPRSSTKLKKKYGSVGFSYKGMPYPVFTLLDKRTNCR